MFTILLCRSLERKKVERKKEKMSGVLGRNDRSRLEKLRLRPPPSLTLRRPVSSACPTRSCFSPFHQVKLRDRHSIMFSALFSFSAKPCLVLFLSILRFATLSALITRRRRVYFPPCRLFPGHASLTLGLPSDWLIDFFLTRQSIYRILFLPTLPFAHRTLSALFHSETIFFFYCSVPRMLNVIRNLQYIFSLRSLLHVKQWKINS